MTTIYLVTTYVRTENEETAYAEPFLNRNDAITYFVEVRYYKELYPNLSSDFEVKDIDWKTINQNNALYLSISDYSNPNKFISITFRVIDR